MLNPNPPHLLGADPKSPSTSDSTYETDQPYEQVAPHVLGKKRHRWFSVWDIGAMTRGAGSISIASPLPVGASLTINADQKPEYWIVGIIVNTANAQLGIWTGQAATGYPIRIGNGGRVIIPAQGLESLTVRNLGAGAIIGTIMAVAGFDREMFDYIPASQA